MRILFPGVPVRMNGWLQFLCKRSRLLDTPFRLGLLPVRSRYRAWAELAGCDWKAISDQYLHHEVDDRGRRFIVHVGAQWPSKQYPHACSLIENLRKKFSVEIIAGPGDVLPDGIDESMVLRVADRALVEKMLDCTDMIGHDSGPMHLAAMFGKRTWTITNLAAMSEWLPPGVCNLDGGRGYKGYRPRFVHPSTELLTGWVDVQTLLKALALD